MKLLKQELQNKIEPFIYAKIEKKEYQIIRKNPIELLTWNRLDLAFKLFYLDNKNKLKDLAEEVYYQDIKSQTLGSFKERGNDQKYCFKKYIKEFETIYEDIKNNGFNETKTIVPLSEVGTIINGAHRVASAIHLGKQIICVNTKLPIMTCDYKYFYERGVSEDVLDVVVQKFIEYAENTYIAFLWPSGKGNKDEAEDKFLNVVYKKKISLTPNGAFNLLYELYKHMDWVGDKSNRFKGVQQKLIECFPNFEPFNVIIFQVKSLEKVKEIKKEVRKIYNLGFSSIHITDTKEEAIRISKLILNKNGIHFLNYAKPIKSNFVIEQLAGFKIFIQNNNIDSKDILIDGSFILSLYGLREAKDIDYLIDDNSKIETLHEYKEVHDSELKYHGVTKFELLYDQSFHFWFDELKFVSFNQLYKMKKNRGEEKDRNDCKIMEALIKNNTFKKIFGQMKQSFLYFKIKSKKNIRETIFFFLKITKLYGPIKAIYRKIRDRK